MIQNNQEFSLPRELARKTFHIFLLTLPLGYYLLGRWNALKIIAPITAIIFLLDYYRGKNKTIEAIFNKMFGIILRQKEQKDQLLGITWTFLSACAIFLLCEKEIAIISFLILAICDFLAAIVGKTIKSKPFFEKSFAGSCAFYISGVIILFASVAFFNLGFWFFFFALFALFATTIIEARPSYFSIDDNFTIPVSFAAIMTIFDLMWNII